VLVTTKRGGGFVLISTSRRGGGGGSFSGGEKGEIKVGAWCRGKGGGKNVFFLFKGDSEEKRAVIYH